MPKIIGYPEDGDVRNTVLFKETAPYIQSITLNRYVYELVLLHKSFIENNDRFENRIFKGFDAVDINSAFGWALSPQGHEFWSELYREVLRTRRDRLWPQPV